MPNQVSLQMKSVSKSFPGVQALDDVTFECLQGEVHALVGENGAGKSTLMKILVGAIMPDRGDIILHAQKVRIGSPKEAENLGVTIIYQELNLIPKMTVAENIFLGREPLGSLGLIDTKRMRVVGKALLDDLGVELNLDQPVEDLTVAQQQMVEIAKALSVKATIIVMDEPSSALGGAETEHLNKIIASLKARGVTVIYISHRLEEVFRVSDRITVLKDGRVMGTVQTSAINQPGLVKMMVGRSLEENFPPRAGRIDRDRPLLEVRGVNRGRAVRDCSFVLYPGEVLGIAGLVGSGRTELVRAINGVDHRDSGEVLVEGRPARINWPKDAKDVGIGFVTEDRRGEGLVLWRSVRENISLACLQRLQRFTVVKTGEERAMVGKLIADLDIRTPGPEQQVQYLSGGNQQKVVLAKWLATSPRILIFDEPTRGIDVGAKSEIYHLMRRLANAGAGIIMISSELPEILGMADRILVMSRGLITAEFVGGEATEEQIMLAATGAGSVVA